MVCKDCGQGVTRIELNEVRKGLRKRR